MATRSRGCSATREWSSGDARGNFHANADLHLPLDGAIGLSVAAVFLSNRLQKPVPDLGMKASWKCGGGLHSVYGDAGIWRRSARPGSTATAPTSSSASESKRRPYFNLLSP